jgi:hypothetical protein
LTQHKKNTRHYILFINSQIQHGPWSWSCVKKSLYTGKMEHLCKVNYQARIMHQ